MIPKKLYIRKLDIDIFNNEINLTRAWVADQPCTGRMEYTDLSQVWHSQDEEPEEERQVVAIDKKGIAFSGVYRPFYQGYTPRYAGVYWNGGGCLAGAVLVYRKDISKWAYIDDLLAEKITEDGLQG